MHEILHIAEHAFLDSLKVLPFLFLGFLVMEFCERHSTGRLVKLLGSKNGTGALAGSALGLIPQCGFSVTAANLYAGGLIGTGTLVAVLLATSDEAFLILLGAPGGIKTVIMLALCKFILAFLCGFVIDLAFKNRPQNKDVHDLCVGCGCEDSKGIVLPALKHTVKIFLFLLLCNLLLDGTIELIGEENIKRFLLTGNLLQPFIAAIIGLIPNCASSVMLTELYVSGIVSFGALLTGLCVNSGVAIIVLFKQNRPHKENLTVLFLTFIISLVAGLLFTIIS